MKSSAILILVIATICMGEPPVDGFSQQQYGAPQQQSQQYGAPQPQQQQQRQRQQEYGPPAQQQSQQYQQTSQQYGAPVQQQQQQQQPQQQSQYGPPGYTPGQPIGQSDQQCPPNDPQFNRQLVLKAYQEVFGDHNLANIDEYYVQDYIQHNPMIPDGLDAIKGLIASIPDPPMQIDFKRVAADGDLVWTHSRFSILGTTYAAVDIFRIECGKIKEHWDVLQDINLKMPSANSHPFF